MFFGAVLVGLALSLFVYNKWDADRAARAAEQALEKVEDAAEDDGSDTFYFDPNWEMTVVNVDGFDYIGYITIPSEDLRLPVMSEWSYEGLKIAPGRFSGTTYADNLVIAGHNYARHFSLIKWLEIGTAVYFTDMNDHIWQYEVVAVETLNPTQVEEMSEKTEEDDWDLTLFTCNTGGQTRCAVRCARVK